MRRHDDSPDSELHGFFVPGRFARAILASALLAAAFSASPAEAADMRHRLQEHLLEAYFIGSFGSSMTGRHDETVPGLLHAQLGVGVAFPGTGCLGLGAWGFELVGGPAIPLGNPDLRLDTHFLPGFFIEIPISNLQLIGRVSAILPVMEPNTGISLAFLAGWYARPVTGRLGLVYDFHEDGRAFTGLRLELLWLGEDPIPPR